MAERGSLEQAAQRGMMISRGPFQPPEFCDSVKQQQKKMAKTQFSTSLRYASEQ